MSRKAINLIGRKFGKLEVINRSNRICGSGNIYWECKCECGEIKDYRTDVLRKTNIKHCGCGVDYVKIGDRVGKLKVIEKMGRNGRKSIYWKCRCGCGKDKDVILSSYSIKKGIIKSCGCLKHPCGKAHSSYKGYKDLSGRFFHKIEIGANERNIEFKITKKQIWELFKKQNKKCALSGIELQFGVNSKIEEKKRECTASLDRIDNTKGYVKGNVQWVHKHINTMKRNHRQNYFIELCDLISKNCSCGFSKCG